MKPIVVKFPKINKPHNLQNITGYMVSMTLLWVKLFFCVSDRQACFTAAMWNSWQEQNGCSSAGGVDLSSFSFKLISPSKDFQAMYKLQCGYILFFFKWMITVSTSKKPVCFSALFTRINILHSTGGKINFPKNPHTFVCKQLDVD